MEPVGRWPPVEHRPAIPAKLLGQVVDLGARDVTLKAGESQLKEAGED